MRKCDYEDIRSNHLKDDAHRLREVEARLSAAEKRISVLEGELQRKKNLLWREKFKPKLGQLEQYLPRKLRFPESYYAEALPIDPPSICIVTPSLNQAQFLGATIDSVMSQGYPNLAYVIQDSCSNDTTQSVVAPWRQKLTFRTEPDNGQADAINRGFAGVDCDLMAYLNSDDVLAPGTLSYVASFFKRNPGVDLVYGHRIVIDAQNDDIGRWILPQHDYEIIKWADYIPQETLFWRKRVWNRLKGFDVSLNFALDWDFILRAQSEGFRFKRLPRFLGCFRVHDAQKSAKIYDVGVRETQMLRARYLGDDVNWRAINRATRSYMRRHVFLHRLYKLKVLRY